MTTRDQSLEIRVNGEKLAATLIIPKTTLPGVLCVHGWGGSQEQYLFRAREAAALGCIGLTFDLRGHASSASDEELVSREDNLSDVLAAYDELVGHPSVDKDAIAVVGSSYGGYLAAILTTLRPVKWLAMRVPAIYQDEGWTRPKMQLHKDADFHAYRRRALRPEDNRALRACADFKGDVLIVESENDDIIPHETIRSYVNAASQARSLTYRVIQGADHALTEEAEQRAYSSVLVNWLTEMVFGARQGGTTAQASARTGTAPEEGLERSG